MVDPSHSVSTYRTELEQVAAQFRGRGAMAWLAGAGPAMFLVCELGARGAEVYRGNDGVYFEPAADQQLLGDVRFDTMEEAVEAAWRWLEHGERP